MDTPLQIRASSTPRLIKCPASGFQPQIANTSVPAILGTVAHLAFEQIVKGEEVNLENLAKVHDVSLDELTSLYWGAKEIWAENGRWFQEPETEVDFNQRMGLPFVTPEYNLTGHADILSVSGRNIMVADWKTGWKDSDYSAQLKTYAALAWLSRRKESTDQVYVAVFWVRTREVEGHWFSVDQLRSWLGQLTNAVERGLNGEFVVGEHCHYCPVAVCPALQAKASFIVPFASLDLQLETPLVVTAENAVELYHLSKAIRKRCDDVDALVENFVANNGAVDTGDGKQLRYVPKTTEKIALNADSSEYLGSFLSEDDLRAACTLSKTKVLDAVRAQAGRGEKKAAAQECMNALKRMGAVSESHSESLGIARPQED